MAEATITPQPDTSADTSLPSADDLQAQFDAPSYEGADAQDNQPTGGESDFAMQSQLRDAQNKARLQQIRAAQGADPLRQGYGALPRQKGTGAEQYQAQAGTTIDNRLGNTGVTRAQGGNDRRVQARDGQRDSLQETRERGGQETQAQRNQRANREASQPNDPKAGVGDRVGQQAPAQDRLAQLRGAARRVKEGYTKPEVVEDPDYPYPISNARYLVWVLVTVIQDGQEILLDLIGIGWITGPLMLAFFTIPFYCYWIFRFVPKSMRYQFILPSVMASGLNVIPGLGEILPEWVAVSLGGWFLLKDYETGGSFSSSVKGKLESYAKKVGGQQTSSAGQGGGGGGGGSRSSSSSK